MHRIIYMNEDEEGVLATFVGEKLIAVTYLFLQYPQKINNINQNAISTVDNGIFGKKDKKQTQNEKKIDAPIWYE